MDGWDHECSGLLLKLVDSGHVVSFDKRAVVAWTCELAAVGSDIIVAFAVRSRSELFEELQVRECGEIDSCFFMLLVTSV